jgi:hypothetical protein
LPYLYSGKADYKFKTRYNELIKAVMGPTHLPIIYETLNTNMKTNIEIHSKPESSTLKEYEF